MRPELSIFLGIRWSSAMATVAMRRTKPVLRTLADLLERLGNVPLERVRLQPPPGTATEKDVIAAWSGLDRRLCELVQGTLVEKTVGTKEAVVATLVCHFLWKYLDKHDLGLALGADGMFRLKIGLVRIPDAAFISWDRLPEGKLSDEAIAKRIPELAVEVLSPGNTPKEMALKLDDFFNAGVKLGWLIYPKTETAEEYTSRTDCRQVTSTQSLEGHDVLPGFRLPLKKLFARTRRRG
jgi:Uma2 family endonuclease